jgi:glycosyltransferase involved in cell wall biosynthesis
MNDLRIVIPAYNEEAGIGEVIDRIKKTCPEAELLIIDDCSKDHTASVAKSCGATVVSNAKNLNYGGALKVGFNYQQSPKQPIKYIAFLDADGTYPPEDIPDLYKKCKLEGNKIAVGSRFLGKNKGMPWHRKIGNRIFAWLITAYTGNRITDSASGLRVFEISLVPLFQSLPDDLSLTPAMSVNALYAGISYAEIPIEYARREGNSKLSSIKDGWRFLRGIMIATRKNRPWAFYCTLGLPFLLIESFIKKPSNSIK